MKLHLFTANYPYGTGESYLNNELPFLQKEFKAIFIYPQNTQDMQKHTISNDLTVEPFVDKAFKPGIKDKGLLIKIFLTEFFHIKQKRYLFKNAKFFLATLKKGLQLAKWIETQEQCNKKDAYYSFWMNDWALALAILKKQNKIKKFIFRVNGYDIFDERHSGNYLPFRYFIYSQAKKVFTLSKTTEAYLKSLNIFPEKIVCSYFGTTDHGFDPKDNKIFTIFSCSSVIPLKRIDKIAAVISHLDFPVKWIHHGDGPELPALFNITNKFPDHIKFEQRNKTLDYNDVLTYEKALSPDLFINLSTTEGLPVTLLEALSFGVPLLVNDVGSCSELITKDTGVVVAKNKDPNKIAEIISQIKTGKSFDKQRIREYWQKNFSAETNYTIFSRQLKQLFYDN